MSDEFWIRHDNKVLGPYSAAQMKDLAFASRISPADEISKDQERWIAACRVRALKFRREDSSRKPQTPDAANDEYWVRHPDRAHGPYSGQELKELAVQRLVQSGDEVSLNRRHWRDASTISGLLMSPRRSSATIPVVYCPECGRPHEAGVIRCAKCNACLRPAFLAVFTLVGLVFNSLGALASFVMATMAEQKLMPVLGTILSLAAVLVLAGLRRGRYWAWIGIHVLWGTLFAVVLVRAIVTGFNEEDEPITVLLGAALSLALGAFLMAPWWIYVHGERVKAFCSLGRPME